MTFRQQYNRKMSKYFLIGLYLHLPVFMFMAFHNDHGLLSTLAMCGLILAGPTVAYAMGVSSSVLPCLIAFSGMAFSGMLIHLGNGMIEMHFHVFIMLATLIAFGLISAVLTGVVTIAIHHLGFFFLLPASVFNYQASVWIVLLHAGFVIIEAVPSLMVAYRFRYFIDMQDTTISQLDEISTRSLHLVSNIDVTGKNLATASQSTAQQLKETEKSIEELHMHVEKNLMNSKEAQSISKQSEERAHQGYENIQLLIEAVRDISGSAGQIKSIVSLIEDIAFQTNLLALNAAVEAARAGEQGRGFGVVAEAVRGLALKCSTSAKDISTLVNGNVEKIGRSEKLVGEGGEVLKQIVAMTKKLSTLNDEIAMASGSQNQDLTRVKGVIHAISLATNENAQFSRDLTEASSHLMTDSETLGNLVREISEDDQKAS